MQLTRYTDYGIRILMYLAIQPERDSLVRIAEVTDVFGLSANHVAKIINQLGRIGYIETIRGKSGGFKLAKPSQEIRLGSLVRELEQTLVPVNCDSPRCEFLPVCKLKGVLVEALSAYFAVLDRYTLHDITTNKQELLSTIADRTISVLNVG